VFLYEQDFTNLKPLNPLLNHNVPKIYKFTYLLYLAFLMTWPLCFCCYGHVTVLPSRSWLIMHDTQYDRLSQQQLSFLSIICMHFVC